ncbi:MFS transporter [Desulfoluna butyratoxydans]|uniref:Major facilitator superfamily n=1 Tax=Desulfoluna butyratoxydans TaxID=231438 RepID=A0A4U8YHZ5_9BACT|nr:MFS transporter [Desulfoluna butyratoxydans]VFQ42930.1 major facilitator superfamily [Desulfoluna butyratoxydans]
MYRFLLLLTLGATFGLQSWRILFDNFSVQVIGLDGSHVGAIQSIREIPGFLALLVVYVTLFLKEHRIASLSVIILGIGVCVTGWFPSFWGLALTTLAMSFGFHYFETVNQSLTLQYFDRDTAPLVLGKLRSFGAATAIFASVLFFCAAPFLSFEGMYILSGAAIVALGIYSLVGDPTHSDAVPQRKKAIFRKRYWLFYFLTFMAGARRQIFVAFSVFLMVQRFGFSIQEIAVLFLFNNLVNYFLSPFIGKAIVRFGERRILSLEYLSLIFIFIAYAFAESRVLVAALYILDHIFFNFAIAIRTFFQKVADPRDIAPSMAAGFTINHIAAVVLPFIGGLLWVVDYRIPFIGGAVMACVSLAAVQRIPAELRRYQADMATGSGQ